MLILFALRAPIVAAVGVLPSLLAVGARSEPASSFQDGVAAVLIGFGH